MMHVIMRDAYMRMLTPVKDQGQNSYQQWHYHKCSKQSHGEFRGAKAERYLIGSIDDPEDGTAVQCGAGYFPLWLDSPTARSRAYYNFKMPSITACR